MTTAWLEHGAELSPAHDDPARHTPDVDVTDPYGTATAEFYDLLATDHWLTFGLQLRDLFATVDVTAGPILDIGAGTGVGLHHLLAAVPGAKIRAIEPSRAMRTALHARLQADDDLRSRTTVDPRAWVDAELPERACATVMSAVLGHFDLTDRHRLWNFVADRMPEGAPAVIELLPPYRPIEVPLTKYRELRVGEFVYEGWQSGSPVDDRDMSWTMEYRVRHGEATIAVSVVRSRWTCLGVDDVASEIAPFGLSLEEHDDCVVISC